MPTSGANIETLGWIAIESGVVTNTEGQLVSGITSNSHDESDKEINYGTTLNSDHYLFAKLATNNGSDQANIRVVSTSSTGFVARLDEETTGDGEQDHTNEQIAYLAIDGWPQDSARNLDANH